MFFIYNNQIVTNILDHNGKQRILIKLMVSNVFKPTYGCRKGSRCFLDAFSTSRFFLDVLPMCSRLVFDALSTTVVLFSKDVRYHCKTITTFRKTNICCWITIFLNNFQSCLILFWCSTKSDAICVFSYVFVCVCVFLRVFDCLWSFCMIF